MGPSAVRVGCVAVAASIAALTVGCGKTSDTSPIADDAPFGAGGSDSAQAGRRAIESGGSSAHAGSAGTTTGGGAPSDAGGGQGSPSGVGGGASGGTAGAACAVVHHVEVPLPFRSSLDPHIVKAGSEFALTDGQTLLAVSWSGELARQHFERQVCPGCDGLFGSTPLRSDADWRLLSIDRVGSEAAARAWRMSDPSAPEAQPLFGPEFSGLVSAFALGASRDGVRAVFANGHRVVTQEVTFAALDADGRMTGPANTLEIPLPSWDNLSIVPTAHGAALSVLAESVDRSQRVWLLSELDASGQLVFSSQSALPLGQQCSQVASGGCAIVEDAEGYYLSLHDETGVTRIARLLRARPNELIINDDLMQPQRGGLATALPRTLIFLTDETSGPAYRLRFVGLPKSGGGESQTLAFTPIVDAESRPRFQLIAVEGNSIFYGIQSQDSLLLEELSCSSEL